MRAGPLNKRLTVQCVVETQVFGKMVPSNVVLATVWAEVEPLS
ncbi:unnamed protein product, partial [marine sediment metagenome]